MKKRITSLLLSLLMVVSIFPAPAYATDSMDVSITPTEIPTEAVTEPSVAAATEAGCPTCGSVGCISEHLAWCSDCKVDDCGKTHVFCEICQKNDCGVDHTAPQPCTICGSTECGGSHENWCADCRKDNCGVDHTAPQPCTTCGSTECGGSHENWCADCKKDNCGVDHTEPQPCTICGSTECGGRHENWCADCKKDNCGVTHVFCETCQKNDCGVDHIATESTETPTDPGSVIDDGNTSDSAYLANKGRKATINPTAAPDLPRYFCGLGLAFIAMA